MCSACWRRGWGTGRGIIWGEFGVLGGVGGGVASFFFLGSGKWFGANTTGVLEDGGKEEGMGEGYFLRRRDADDEWARRSCVGRRWWFGFVWLGVGGLAGFGLGWLVRGAWEAHCHGRPCIFRRLVPSFAVISSVHVTACYLTMVFYSIFIHTISLMSTKVFFRLG